MGGQNNSAQSGHGQPGHNGHRTNWNNQFQQNNQIGNNHMITNHNQVSTNPTEPKSEPNQIKTEPGFPNFSQPSPANPGLGPGVAPKTEPPSKSPIQIKTEPTNQNDRNVNSVEIRSNISSEFSYNKAFIILHIIIVFLRHPVGRSRTLLIFSLSLNFPYFPWKL